MLLSRPRGGRPAGEPTALGAWLDARLPQPKRRAALRDWRRSRPFWGGLLLIASGAELLLAPLSPLGVLVSLGIGGIAAIGIGLALALAGVFLWVTPQARAYVSLNALLLSVIAFAVTNLGGFVIGSLLGIAGSAMGFGWTPQPATPEPRPDEEEEQEQEQEQGQSQSQTQTQTQGRTRARGTLSVLLPVALLAALAGPTAPEAHAAPGAAAAPRAAHVPGTITTTRFAPEGFAFAGVEEVPTAEGPLKVIVLRMKAATLSDYRLATRDRSSRQMKLRGDEIELRGNVTLYLKKFSGCIEGLVCVTFSPEGLPAPPVIPPFVFMTDVIAEQAMIVTDSLRIDGLGIDAAADPAPKPAYDTAARPPEAPGDTGSRPSKPDAPTPEPPDRPDAPADPTDPEEPATPGGLTVGEPRRERTDDRRCERVSLTLTHTGDRPVTDGTVTFTTRIVGALGFVWATETSRRELPSPVEKGKSVTKTWKVCVDKKHTAGLLLGRHLEHEATVAHPGGRPEPVTVPRS